jgi:hypothetical protein
VVVIGGGVGDVPQRGQGTQAARPENGGDGGGEGFGFLGLYCAKLIAAG